MSSTEKKDLAKRKETTSKIDSISKNDIYIENNEGLKFLKDIKANTTNLILTDPPYITSRDTGMDKLAKDVSKVEKNGKNMKTEADWKKYKTKKEWTEWMKDNKIPKDKQESKLEELKKKYIKYGSIYGKKYAVVTDYGDWDSKFTMETLEKFIKEYYRILKDGGTVIIFFDLWKITKLKELLEKYKFKQIRFIEWIKTNPQPLNSSVNYLTNCREIALTAVKKGSPTFNSKYDNGLYKYPLQGGKKRFHPTQKSLDLFEELIDKHSNEGDLVIDTFLGSGTTAIASKNKKRKFKGCEVSKEYYDKIKPLI